MRDFLTNPATGRVTAIIGMLLFAGVSPYLGMIPGVTTDPADPMVLRIDLHQAGPALQGLFAAATAAGFGIYAKWGTRAPRKPKS